MAERSELLDGPAGPLRAWRAPGDGEGEGALPVLLLHPINMETRAWLDVAARLAPARPWLGVDLRGHGGSAPDGPFGVEPWLADVAALLDHAGVERFHAVGGSLGGTLAVLLAAGMPERVVSAASFGGTLHVEGDVAEFAALLDEHGVAGTFRMLVPQLSLGPQASDELIERTLALVNPNTAAVVRDVLAGALATDVRDAVGGVRAPTLIACGEHDKTCPPEQGRAMADALGVPLRVLPGVGHLPMLEDPDGTARLISGHLAQAEAE